MLMKFHVPHAHGEGTLTWINPDHVAGVHTAAPEVTTIYLVGGFEQRVAGRSDEVARQIDEAQRRAERVAAARAD